MYSIIRCIRVAAVPVMLLALGCSSTTSTPNPVEEQPKPISEKMEPNAKIEAEVPEASVTLAPVYFDTDVAALRPEAIDTLKGYAKAILEHPEWGALEIEGHCDERGADAYNLALGQRRAAAVKRHLVNMGVPDSRLTTRTFGSRKPVVRGHDEGAWRYNRRSELLFEVGEVLASNQPD